MAPCCAFGISIPAAMFIVTFPQNSQSFRHLEEGECVSLACYWLATQRPVRRLLIFLLSWIDSYMPVAAEVVTITPVELCSSKNLILFRGFFQFGFGYFQKRRIVQMYELIYVCFEHFY
jgi:hypothetical protein